MNEWKERKDYKGFCFLKTKVRGTNELKKRLQGILLPVMFLQLIGLLSNACIMILRFPLGRSSLHFLLPHDNSFRLLLFPLHHTSTPCVTHDHTVNEHSIADFGINDFLTPDVQEGSVTGDLAIRQQQSSVFLNTNK
jgi:hypothetical protein